ncbi:hypothetical protein NPIL_22481 [Nephila pilipes]|uniref:Uncharacterized protein n=1 Tax=Nephila pilipes TaxID=299642 RepID=A0A8X6NN61_NEPPI|nr:hypothetical protein NPIL_22481 [Nephila pilipes]
MCHLFLTWRTDPDENIFSIFSILRQYGRALKKQSAFDVILLRYGCFFRSVYKSLVKIRFPEFRLGKPVRFPRGGRPPRFRQATQPVPRHWPESRRQVIVEFV